MSDSARAIMKLISFKFPQHQAAVTPVNDRKRKRQPELEDHLRSVVGKRTSQSSPARPENKNSMVKGVVYVIKEIDRIDHSRKKGSWPRSILNKTRIPGRISQEISTKRAGLKTSLYQIWSTWSACASMVPTAKMGWNV